MSTTVNGGAEIWPRGGAISLFYEVMLYALHNTVPTLDLYYVINIHNVVSIGMEVD